MSMGPTRGLEKAINCLAAIVTAFTLAKFSDDDTMEPATAVGDAIVGVFQHTTSNADETVRVMLSGISQIKLGGAVTRGGFITAGAGGVGVAAAPAAGVNNSVIGRALQSGVSGDIISVHIAPGQIQGA